MPLGSLNGYARASASNPIGVFVCDRCTFVYPRTKARKQFDWAGTRLADTGLIVCPKCLDVPFEQSRTLILPPDPIPFPNPRPDWSITPPATKGFSPPFSPPNQGYTGYQLGSVADQTWPTTKAAVLSQISALSGFSVLGGGDVSIVLTSSFATLPLITQASGQPRSWVLIYNPCVPQAGIDQGTAGVGQLSTLLLGPGQAWFQATGLALGTCYQGPLTAVGTVPGLPLWCWIFPGGVVPPTNPVLQDDQGNVITDDQGNPIGIVPGGSAPVSVITDDQGNPITDDQGNPINVG